MYVVYSDANEQESNLLLFLPRCCCCCFCSWGKCVRARSSLGHVYIVVYSLWSPSPPSRLSALNFIAQPLERSKSLLIKSITLQLSNSPSLSLVHVSLPPLTLKFRLAISQTQSKEESSEVFRWWVSRHYILYYEFTCTNQAMLVNPQFNLSIDLPPSLINRSLDRSFHLFFGTPLLLLLAAWLIQLCDHWSAIASRQPHHCIITNNNHNKWPINVCDTAFNNKQTRCRLGTYIHTSNNEIRN